MPGDSTQPRSAQPSDADDAHDLALVRAIQSRGSADHSAWTELVTRYQHRLYAVCLKMVNDRDAAADLTQDSFVKIIQGISGYDARSKLSTWMIRVAMNTCLSYLRAQKFRRHASLNQQGDTDNSLRPNTHKTGIDLSKPPEISKLTGSITTEDSQSTSETRREDQKNNETSKKSDLENTPKKVVNQPIFTGPGGPGQTSDWREQTREQTPDESVRLNERRRLVADALASLPAEQRAILVFRDVQDLDYEQIAQAMDLAVGTVKSRLFRARLALREAIESLERAGGSGASRVGNEVPPPTRGMDDARVGM